MSHGTVFSPVHRLHRCCGNICLGVLQHKWCGARQELLQQCYSTCNVIQAKSQNILEDRGKHQAISYIPINHEAALSSRPIPAGLPHRAAVLYIKPNHEAVLSPSLDPYLQVFHVGLQVLPAPLRSLLEDSLEARCWLTRQLLHVEELHQLLGACVLLHRYSSQHTQVRRHVLCSNQSFSLSVCQSGSH